MSSKCVGTTGSGGNVTVSKPAVAPPPPRSIERQWWKLSGCCATKLVDVDDIDGARCGSAGRARDASGAERECTGGLGRML